MKSLNKLRMEAHEKYLQSWRKYFEEQIKEVLGIEVKFEDLK